jgi:hypothetical protein
LISASFYYFHQLFLPKFTFLFYSLYFRFQSRLLTDKNRSLFFSKWLKILLRRKRGRSLFIRGKSLRRMAVQWVLWEIKCVFKLRQIKCLLIWILYGRTTRLIIKLIHVLIVLFFIKWFRWLRYFDLTTVITLYAFIIQELINSLLHFWILKDGQLFLGDITKHSFLIVERPSSFNFI